jgi:hypothetical protein
MKINKKKKKFFNDYILPIISLGSLILSFILASKITFIPNIGICTSDEIVKSLCETPYLGHILDLFNTGVLTGIIIWVIILGAILFILNQLGFKFKDVDTSY